MRTFAKTIASLSVATLTLLSVSCTGKKAETPKDNDTTDVEVTDNGGEITPAVEIIDRTVSPATPNFRVYNLDEVMMRYKLAEDVRANTNADAKKLQSKANEYDNTLANMEKNITNKMQNNGYMSEASYNDDVKKYSDKREEYAKALDKMQQEMAEKANQQQQMLLDSINNYLKAYNASRNYDAILVNQPCQLISPELDITEEIVNGLNSRYNPF